MLTLRICPRCKQEIDHSRIQQTPMVCDSCGFVVSTAEARVREVVEKSILKAALVGSVIIVALFMHVGSWGNHSLEIIPLKIGQATHTSSTADLERMVQIGMDIHKYDWVETLYAQLVTEADPQNFVRLGKFQLSRAKYKEAAETYRQYFLLGKRNLDARYDYARALGEIGKTDEAAKNFDYVLKSKPGVRQVTIIQKYVSMLVKAERFDQAQKVIENVRRQDPSAGQFMDTEYKVISARKRST